MVRLLSLEASNFKRLNLQRPLELGEGITLIAGQNESGKSTILDAILYGLFTRTIRPGGKPRDEDLLQYGTNKLSLSLSFIVEDRRFVVERRIHRTRPNEATLNERLPNGSLRAIATKVNAVTDEIAKLLGGLTFDEIVASNVVAQKELNKIVEQRRGDRIGVINAFLNLESFNRAAEKLADEKRAIEGTPSTPGTLTVARDKLEELRTQLKELKDKKEELEQTQTNLTNLSKKTEETRKEHKKKHELLEKLQTYQEALARKNQIASDIKNKEELLRGVKGQIDDLESKQENYSSLKDELKKYEGIDQLPTAMDRLSIAAQDLENRQLQLQTSEKSAPIGVAGLQKTYQEIRAYPGALGIQQAQKIRQNAKTIMIASALLTIAGAALGVLVGWIFFALVAAGIIGLMYSTRQSGRASALTAQHADYVARVRSYEDQSRISAEHENRLSALRTQVSEARQKLAQAINDVGRYRELARGPTQDPVQISHDIANRFDQEMSQRRILSTKIEQLDNDLKKRPDLENQEKTISGAIKELQRQHDAIILPELPERITYSDELLVRTRTEDQSLHDAIVKNDENIRNLKDNIGKLTKFIEEKKDLPHQTEVQEKTVQGLEKRLRIVNDARMGLDKTSESLRTRVKPSVEYYMSIFLPSVTMNRYKAVRLDDDYKLSVWDAEAGEYRPREVFSGGTEDQLLLVMRLAFALALTPEARGTRPEFLFLDEPLGSSDEVRRGEIIQLLKTELAQYFKQILLVSHVEGLEQEVDHIVRLENGRVVEEV
jgi:exonuclease SbcC